MTRPRNVSNDEGASADRQDSSTTDGFGQKSVDKGGSWRVALDLVTTAAMLGTAGVLIWAVLFRKAPSPPEPKVPSSPISLGATTTQGNPNANVGLLVLSDFECPFCAKFGRETLPVLQREFVSTGKVLLAYSNLPLPIHSQATGAAESAECADKQNLFWPLHDRLFADPAKLDAASLRASAEALSFDMKAFDQCLKAGEGSRALAVDLALAKSLQITGTPTVFLGPRTANGDLTAMKVLVGARPVEDFRAALQEFVK